MISGASGELFADFEAAVGRGWPGRNTRMSRQVASLFVARADRFWEKQAEVFYSIFQCPVEQNRQDNAASCGFMEKRIHSS